MSSQRKLTQLLQTPSDRHSVVFRFDYDVADKVKPTTMVLTSSTKGANGYVHKRTTVKAENRFTATDGKFDFFTACVVALSFFLSLSVCDRVTERNVTRLFQLFFLLFFHS